VLKYNEKLVCPIQIVEIKVNESSIKKVGKKRKEVMLIKLLSIWGLLVLIK
jgi:hypothetical protein